MTEKVDHQPMKMLATGWTLRDQHFALSDQLSFNRPVELKSRNTKFGLRVDEQEELWQKEAFVLR